MLLKAAWINELGKNLASSILNYFILTVMDHRQKDLQTSKIKVAIVISNLGVGGAENQVVEIANNIDKHHFDLHIFLLSSHMPLASRLHDKEKCLHVVEKKWKYDVTTIARLAFNLRKYHIDIVHGFLFDAEIASRIAGKIVGCKVIGSERNTENSKGTLRKFVYKHTSKMVDICIANSNAGVDFNHSVSGLPMSSYRVVHNGVDLDRFRPYDVSKLKDSLNIKQQCVVGMFGSFKQQKNHQLFFRAAKCVLQQEPNVTFILVGGTIHEGDAHTHEYEKQLLRLMKQLDIMDNFHILGKQKMIEEYYNLCDITVLPSLYEGMPNVALESMACGVPVIATDVSDNSYVIPDGKAGFIIPSGDERQLATKILQLINDKELRSNMGKEARSWVKEKFSVSKMAREMANVYFSLIA